MVLAVLLLLFVLIMGPTLYIANTLVASIGNYLFNLIPMSFTTAANGDRSVPVRAGPSSTGCGGPPGGRSWARS